MTCGAFHLVHSLSLACRPRPPPGEKLWPGPFGIENQTVMLPRRDVAGEEVSQRDRVRE